MSYFVKFTILWILYNILACTEQNKETYTKDHSDSVIKVEIENDLLDHLDILPSSIPSSPWNLLKII